MQQKILSKEARRAQDTNVKVADIPLNQLTDNPFQPRKRYPKEDIKLLAKSISERGLLQPIAVVQIEEGYVVVGGHRRTRAFRSLHRKTIPAIVRQRSGSDDLALDLAIENAIRKDFSPAEKAQAMFTVLSTIKNVEGEVIRAYSLVTQVKLMGKRGIEKVTNKKGNSVGFTDQDIYDCQRLLRLLGVSENTCLKYFRLLGLPDYIKEKVIAINSNESLSKRRIDDGCITISMAYELSRIKNEKARKELYEKIVSEKWNSITLRYIVDELLESGQEESVSKLGSSKRKGEADYGLEGLSRRSFNLSSSLWNARKKFPIIKLSLDKMVFRSALKKLKKGCEELINSINPLLEDEEGIYERTEVEKIFELDMTPGVNGQRKLRFSFPRKLGDEIGLKAGDKLVCSIHSIKRKQEVGK